MTPVCAQAALLNRGCTREVVDYRSARIESLTADQRGLHIHRVPHAEQGERSGTPALLEHMSCQERIGDRQISRSAVLLQKELDLPFAVDGVRKLVRELG